MRNAIHLNSVGSNSFTSAVTTSALDLEVADLAPDELDRIAALRVARALQRPHHVLRRDRRAVVPESALAHRHQHLGLVLVPAPFGQQARLEGQIGFLIDVGVEHRLVDRLDGRIHRRWPGGRIPGRQRNVVGDGQDFVAPAQSWAVHRGTARQSVRRQRHRSPARSGGVRRRSWSDLLSEVFVFVCACLRACDAASDVSLARASNARRD